MTAAPELEIRHTAALLARGEDPSALYRAARRKELTSIRRGAWADSSAWSALDAADRLVVLAREAQRVASTRPVFSDETAAAALGMPVLAPWPDRPGAIAPRGSGRRSTAAVRWRTADLADDEIVAVGGILVTTPIRTACDLARTRGIETGVAALDFAVHGHPDAAELVQNISETCGSGRGARPLRAAARIATGLSESALESLSLQRFDELGAPQPEQQVVWRLRGAVVRTDFYWREWDVVGEADGRGKYDLHAAGASAAVWQEKLREDALREEVRRVVRWTWRDAWDREPLAAKLRAAGVPLHPHRRARSA